MLGPALVAEWLTTRPPCAVELDTLSDQGLTQPGCVRLLKNYF